MNEEKKVASVTSNLSAVVSDFLHGRSSFFVLVLSLKEIERNEKSRVGGEKKVKQIIK